MVDTVKVTFDISPAEMDEALDVASEMGVTVPEIAASAFRGYLDGVAEARRLDLDER